jgi:hypothetical protein
MVLDLWSQWRNEHAFRTAEKRCRKGWEYAYPWLNLTAADNYLHFASPPPPTVPSIYPGPHRLSNTTHAYKMTRKLLLSGHKPTFELFNFDSSSHLLEKASDSPAPTSSTWLEKSPTLPNIVYASSETENKVYCLSIEGEEARVIDERTTVCTAPVHCMCPSISAGSWLMISRNSFRWFGIDYRRRKPLS